MKLWPQIAFFALLVTGWELMARWLDSLLVPGVGPIFRELQKIATDGFAFQEIGITFVRMSLGFLLALALAVALPVGIATAVSRTTERFFEPGIILGLTVPGFPNLFITYGPNTNLGHGGSVIFNTECQVNYITRLLVRMIEEGIESVECRKDVYDEYNRRVDAAHRRMIWSHKGMDTWYRNAQGRVVIHQRLRESAGINGEVDVLGKHDMLEVWNSERFLAMLDNDPYTDEDAKIIGDLGI